MSFPCLASEVQCTKLDVFHPYKLLNKAKGMRCSEASLFQWCIQKGLRGSCCSPLAVT